MNRLTTALLIVGILAGSLCAQTKQSTDIPESGRIRIDGNLNDWRRAKWFPLEVTIEGNPANISDAKWSLAWDEDAVIYIAVQYDDTDIVLKDGLVNSNAQDGVEIYVRGDTGSTPADYSKTQSSAQRYLIGMTADKTSRIRLGGLGEIPVHNPVKAMVVLEGTRFIYEARVPLYDSFDSTTRRKCSESEIYVDEEIGLDIAIVDVGQAGTVGLLGENDRDKRTDANQIAEHTLED